MSKLIQKCYKFRIYPNQAQQHQLAQVFGCCRFVYNKFLADSQESYKRGEKFKSTYDNQKALTLLKKQPEFAFLKEVDSQALNQALANLGIAYDRFFKKLSYRPRFKKKTNSQSYTTFATNSSKTLKIENNRIYMPKIGWVKIKQHRNIDGRITSGTISKTCAGNYFISIHCVDCTVEEMPKTGKEIGFDLGISSLLVDQNNNTIENPNHIDKTLRRIKKAQRKLSKKQRGSNNYQKQRLKVAKLHEKVANQRHDFLHKLSYNLVKNHDFIAAEDLNVKEMLESDFANMPKWQQRSLHRHITDVSWSELLRQLEYKSDWYGKRFIQINQYFPSSQLCSCCGYKNPLVKDLKVRTWICPECRTSHIRDHNAAKNILAEAHTLAT